MQKFMLNFVIVAKRRQKKKDIKVYILYLHSFQIQLYLKLKEVITESRNTSRIFVTFFLLFFHLCFRIFSFSFK